MWGATRCYPVVNGSIRFQSTHPCGVRHRCCKRDIWWRCFNPRTRVGCDKMRYNVIFSKLCFNPRTRVGCDYQLSQYFDCEHVSIHAPVWGATQTAKNSIIETKVSIHAPVWGATYAMTCYHRLNEFQSTHPCGVRPANFANGNPSAAFQSTHPCGVRRQQVHAYPLTQKVSIHAPVWGATLFV